MARSRFTTTVSLDEETHLMVLDYIEMLKRESGLDLEINVAKAVRLLIRQWAKNENNKA